MGQKYVGIDVGGTTVKLGIVDRDGRIVRKLTMPSPVDVEGERGILLLGKAVRRLAQAAEIPWAEIAGVGLGLPGFLDIPAGKILCLTNIPWENIPVRAILERELDLPVTIDNDANAAALGEAWSGAGKGIRDLICITLGTGVGGGVMTGGRLVRGLSGAAGEIGHIPVVEHGIQCGCGQRGCVETIASATGLVRLATEAVSAGQRTRLARKVEEGLLSPKDIFDAAHTGDDTAQQVIDAGMNGLARVMSILSVVNNPAAFIIGGGVSQAGDSLFIPLRRAYARHTLSFAAAGVQILPARLGNDAGIIGAAGLTWEQEILR